ncbi:MAG: hypothetical protein LKJ49_09260 [Olsenella sp.]|nr:hypothetical protein [Olsenella sp.]
MGPFPAATSAQIVIGRYRAVQARYIRSCLSAVSLTRDAEALPALAKPSRSTFLKHRNPEAMKKKGTATQSMPLITSVAKPGSPTMKGFV